MAIRPDPNVWDQIIKNWQSSTSTKREFCSQLGIGLQQLDYQVRKRRSASRKATLNNFARVIPLAKPIEPLTNLVVALDQRLTLSVPVGSDPTWIGRVLREVLS